MTNFRLKFFSLLLIVTHCLAISVPPALAEDITVQDGSVNDWQNFNVNAGDYTSITVVDAQGNPMVDGRAIINVLQDFASKIDGDLDISGIIAFFNAHGFDIGANADVNVVGGLILSTLKISESDFFAGMAQLNQALNNDPEFISNKGNINVDPGSFLALIAGAIKNTGTIAANGGTAILAAGNEGTLTIGGDGLVSVKITKAVDAEVFDFNGTKVADQIDNSGSITANGGIVKLTAQGAEQLFDNIINHSGIIEASTLQNVNGQIILDGGDEGVVNLTGDLNAKGEEAGETGGTIHVLGHHVGLFDGVDLDVSGDAGGGTVLIGGDYKGGNPLIQNAEATYVAAGVSINASALQTGDGGKIIVWGNESNRTHGTLLAEGGALSGDGGFIETSAHYLNVDGISVSTFAAHGNAGTWLLDPYDLTISSGADNNVTGATPFEPTGASSVLNITTLQTALNNGDVTVETSNDGGAGNGNITVNADLSVGNILTLTAYGSVILNNDISGGGDVVITSQHGDITQNGGAMTGTGGMVFTASEGDVSLTSAGNDIARMDFTGINVTVTDTNGIELGSGQVTNDFSLTTTGAVTQGASLTVGGTATLAAGTGNNITLTNASNNLSSVTITTGNNVTLVDAGTITLGASTASGTLSVTGSTITLGGDLSSDGAMTLTGNVVLGASVTLDTETGGNSAGGALTITGAVSGNAAGRDLTINTTGTSNGAVSLNTFSNGGGNYVNDVSVATGGATTTLNGNISLDDDGAGDASSFTVTGNGRIDISDNVTIDTEQGNTNGATGGAVALGTGNISADASGYTFTINTGNSDAGETGGAVTFGAITNTAGSYLGGFTVNSDAATDGVITMGGNFTTDGGSISLTGDVRTAASRSFDTEQGGGNAAGSVTFGGTLSATAAGADLSFSLTAAGAFSGGNLTFDTINNAGGAYLNDFNMDLDGVPDGALTLNGNVSLDNNGADAASFNLAGSGRVVISETLTIDTEQGNSDGTTGGSVDFFDSTISADASGYTLTINTGNSDAGETGGSMVFGNVTNTAGAYLSGLTLNSDAATDGAITPRDISIDGPLSITGRLNLSGTRTFDTEQENNGNGGSVTLLGSVSGNGAGRDLTINTLTTGAGFSGGAVLLEIFNNTGGGYVNDLTINTSAGAGGTAGSLTLNGNISLDADAADAASLAFTGGDVIISDNVTIDTEQGNTNGETGGAVNFVTSNIYADAAGYTFTINTGNSDAGETGGAVSFGLVDNKSGANSYLQSFVVNTDAATDGAITLGGNVYTDSGALSLTGDIRLSASRTLDTEQGNNGSGGDTTLTGVISASGAAVNLTIDTSTTNLLSNGGAITTGTFNASAGFAIGNLSFNSTAGAGGTNGTKTYTTTGITGSLILDGVDPNAVTVTDTVDLTVLNTQIGTEISKTTSSQFNNQDDMKKVEDSASALKIFYFGGGSDGLPADTPLIDTSAMDSDNNQDFGLTGVTLIA